MLFEEPVPPDFPRATGGALPGCAQKFLAHQVDGRYVVGVTDVELRQRYLGCKDLLQDLLSYCDRKRKEYPAMTEGELLTRVRKGLFSSTETGTTPEENAWILRELCKREAWDVDSSGS